MKAPRPRRMLALALLCPAVVATTAATAPSADPVVAWMKRTAHPFDTCEPRDDQHDLAFLDKLVGDAHIVALGEGTHGTSEFFQMKHRIVRYLATKKGFTVFAMEANMPEASRINDYVLGSPGDLNALLASLQLWPWQTHEVADMIAWMRTYNISGKGRIEFMGFDMQFPDTAAAIARRALAKVDPAGVDSLDDCLHQLRRTGFSNDFASATSALPVEAVAGHHVRYSGWIRTQNVPSTGSAGLWMRADSAQRNGVAFDNMRQQHLNGTHDWQRYAIELDIPRGSTEVDFGMILSGAGQAWFDSLAIEIDGRPWSGDGSIDLSLERAGTRTGFAFNGGTAYELTMQDSVAHEGKRALSIRSIETPSPPGTPPAPAPTAAARRLLERVEGRRAALSAATSPAEADWTIQNVRILDQCARWLATGRGKAARDSSMAENVDWILAHAKPGTKIVLWAHNDHVRRIENRMGSYLAQRHGPDMAVIGLTTFGGQYNAWVAGRGPQSNDLPRPHGDTVEALCHATGLPRFALDLRQAPSDAATRRYFTEPQLMRDASGNATGSQFLPSRLAHDFDAIVFIDQTTATRLMRPQ